MKRRNGLSLAAIVLLFSACSWASSLSDPGGIIRRGDGYANVAVIGEGFSITFNGEPLPVPFNPYVENLQESTFCPTGSDTVPGVGDVNGPDCQFINESGQTIGAISQFFAASGSALAPFTCFNGITNESCSTGPDQNALLFSGLGIQSEVYGDAILAANSLITDPGFHILYFKFDPTTLADINSTAISVPEPASLGLMLSGLFGLGLAWKRKARATNR